MRLLVATTNSNKIKEIRAILRGLDVELLTLDAWPAVSAPEETGQTFADNARQKATYYAHATGELVVAEDSGLEIDALGGAPGVESARFGGVDLDYPRKFALIEEQLRASGKPDRTARFVCALALVCDSSVLFEARGVVEGLVVLPPRGTDGFGYDPIFLYPPYGRTLAEATQEEKAAVSHRGRAFKELRGFLERC
ncbi:MAG TPA: RdgB/HAM1 family non-canonical purine NTP pyrophosphatase [Vicinamibacterales bacterium]